MTIKNASTSIHPSISRANHAFSLEAIPNTKVEMAYIESLNDTYSLALLPDREQEWLADVCRHFFDDADLAALGIP